MEKNHLLLIAFLSLLFSGISKPVAGFPFAPKMDSIKIVFDDQQLILPGESFQIGIISYYKNGKIRKTVGMEGGSAWWWGYKVEVSGGNDFGRYISVNEELVPSKGKYIGIKAYPRKQPELMKELLLPLNYETKITYRPAEGFDKAPGSQIKGELVTEFNNGSQRFFTNLQDSMVSANFQFYGEGGSWKNGEFTIEPDFLKIQGHRASLIVNSLQDRSVTDTFSILLDYKHAYNLQFSGNSGMSGAQGFSDYNPRWVGVGNFYNASGSDGQNGQNGEFGSYGPDIDVWVDLYRDSVLNCDLLYVYAQNSLNDTAYRYLINPDGGSLTVNSQGGDGGDGGDGGRGDDGVSGKNRPTHIEHKMEKRMIQQPVRTKVIKKQKKKVTNAAGKEVEIEENVTVDEVVMEDVEIYENVEVEVYYMPGEPGGPGGWGGAGGLGGVGGCGGNITLYFTDDARPYQHLFIASSEGGSGGKHGSGGIGGHGGSGGRGNPDGGYGADGQSDPSAIGCADRGRSGQIIIKPTQEFFFYTPKKQTTGE